MGGATHEAASDTGRVDRSGLETRFTSVHLTLGNDLVAATWFTDGMTLRPVEVEDRVGGARLDLRGLELFRLRGRDGRSLRASELRLAQPLEPGGPLEARLGAPDHGLAVTWRAELPEGAHYIRQHLDLESVAPSGSALLDEVVMLELPARATVIAGDVDGSPVVHAATIFAGVEHPAARASFDEGRVTVAVRRGRTADRTLSIASAFGVAPAGQLRRAFHAYVGRHRAQPHRPFLNYNTWFDLSWTTARPTAASCLSTLETLVRELRDRRGVALDGFVLDDGWDDLQALWSIDRSSFPDGLAPIHEAARRAGVGLGVWMSPWGGYDPAKRRRVELARREGIAPHAHGLSLADDRYQALFGRTCERFVRDEEVRALKLDGVAAGEPGETDALLAILRALRRAAPSLVVSLTVGSWPSPYWLWYADAIWRGGDDLGLAGQGPTRERWITYRDAQVYRNVVTRAPLFPIAALMTHGVVQGRYGPGAELEPMGAAFEHEVWSYFASGVGLQELYLAPDRLGAPDWDALARAAGWARRRAPSLGHSRWIGGDPAAAEVYGWAAWDGERGVLALRCPAPHVSSLVLDVGAAFELPAGGPERLELTPAIPHANGPPRRIVEPGRPRRFILAPFEVVVLEARAALGVRR